MAKKTFIPSSKLIIIRQQVDDCPGGNRHIPHIDIKDVNSVFLFVWRDATNILLPVLFDLLWLEQVRRDARNPSPTLQNPISNPIFIVMTNMVNLYKLRGRMTDNQLFKSCPDHHRVSQTYNNYYSEASLVVFTDVKL